VSRLDGLSPDLHAVLSLLLSRRRSYAGIARLLDLEERAVRDRAHAALAMLAPREARELTEAERAQVGEYLLGQADAASRRAALATLETSVPAQVWARALATELAPLAAEPLPEVPTNSAAGEGKPAPKPLPKVPTDSAAEEGKPAVEPLSDIPVDGTAGAGEPDDGEPDTTAAAAPPDDRATAPTPPVARTSRVGGMVVLGVTAAVAIAAVLLIVGIGGGGSHATATGSVSSQATGTTATSTASSGLHVNATLPLTSPSHTRAVGIVEVASAKGALGFVMAAEHLPPTSGFRYAAWLYNSPSEAVLLGEGPTVSASGTLKAVGLLPSNASHYRRIVLTEEHSEKPTSPGPVVLGGAFRTG
jgi:hypothetical protein